MQRNIHVATLLAERTLGFMQAQAADDFSEAIELQGAVPGYPFLIGATFPVSLIARALDRAAPGNAEVQAIVARLLDSLLALGDEDGWRYFSLCPDIPPDADDLAQVALLLAERRHPECRERLAGPVRRLMDNAVAPGRFRTWLVASSDQAVRADAAWAAGHDPVHPEVVANVLYALLLLDPEAWRSEIMAGVDWLMGLQESGRWSSYWYYGHAYGTHLVLRLLAAVAARWPGASRIMSAQARARDALLRAQGPDGGWEVARPPLGLVELGGTWEAMPGRTLETALSLSALAFLPADEALLGARDRAIAYLAGVQDPDGGFAAEPYYFTMGLLPHQSRCLTSAAVLSALTFAGHESG